MRWKALTLDAYGTIFWGGTDDLVALLRSLAAQVGASPEMVLRRREELLGEVPTLPFVSLQERDRWILERLREEFRLPLDPSKEASQLSALHSRVVPHPNLRRILESFRGVPVGLVTNADEGVMRRLLSEHSLHFDVVVTSESVGAYKPSPRIFKEASLRLGIEPERILHVGDSYVADVVGAKGAGFSAAWLRRGLPKPSGDLALADLVLEDLSELLSLRGEFFPPSSFESPGGEREGSSSHPPRSRRH